MKKTIKKQLEQKNQIAQELTASDKNLLLSAVLHENEAITTLAGSFGGGGYWNPIIDAVACSNWFNSLSMKDREYMLSSLRGLESATHKMGGILAKAQTKAIVRHAENVTDISSIEPTDRQTLN